MGSRFSKWAARMSRQYKACNSVQIGIDDVEDEDALE